MLFVVFRLVRIKSFYTGGVIAEMKKHTYLKLDSLPAPKASLARCVFYVFVATIDLVFLVLSLLLCNGELTVVQIGTVAKLGATSSCRLVLFFEFLACHDDFVQLRRHLTLDNHSFKSQMTNPFVSRRDVLPMLIGVHEMVCTIAVTICLLTIIDERACSGDIAVIASISTAISYLKFIACVYKSYLRCNRKDPE